MPPPGEKMEIPLVVDQSDYRWNLLRNILKIFDLRKTKMIVAKYTSPIENVISINKGCSNFNVLFNKDFPCC
jgi:hypothetical protein